MDLLLWRSALNDKFIHTTIGGLESIPGSPLNWTLAFTPTVGDIQASCLWIVGGSWSSGTNPQTCMENKLRTETFQSTREASCCEVTSKPLQHRSVWFQRPSAAQTVLLMSQITVPTESYRHNKNMSVELRKVNKRDSLPMGLSDLVVHSEYS